MRRVLLRLALITAAFVAAVLVWIALTLPPRAGRPSGAMPSDLVSGAYHVHSSRSDGSGTVDDIARAAARAGLRFVIFTDHGDATRVPDPPTYRHDVLCIDAVEISTMSGHVVALGLAGAAPYPLAGEARDVIEDIHRLGGWAVAAHPNSPRDALRWQGSWNGLDGLEWFNVDSEWRGQPYTRLAAVALRSLFRAPESVATLFQSPARSLARLDTLSASRPSFTLAALDAHARLGQDVDGPVPAKSYALAFPGYETMFRTVSQTVKIDGPLSGDASTDAAAVLAAIGAGRSFSVMRAFVDAPGALQFSASGSSGRVDYGGTLPVADEGVTIHAAVPAGTHARLVLIRGGAEVTSGIDTLDFKAEQAGPYRVEARLIDRPVPWIVSNVIRIGAVESPATSAAAADRGPGPSIPIDPGCWTIEKDRSSTATVTHERNQVRLQYQLGGGNPVGQYVALACDASGNTPVEGLEFTASSGAPMRLSVQIRLPGGVNGQRWRRSVYLDSSERHVRVPLATLEPVEPRVLRPTIARVQSFLLVIDTLNARPGASGAVVFRDLAFSTTPAPAPGNSKF